MPLTLSGRMVQQFLIAVLKHRSINPVTALLVSGMNRWLEALESRLIFSAILLPCSNDGQTGILSPTAAPCQKSPMP
jgi:hypothetical protein